MYEICNITIWVHEDEPSCVCWISIFRVIVVVPYLNARYFVDSIINFETTLWLAYKIQQGPSDSRVNELASRNGFKFISVIPYAKFKIQIYAIGGES